MRCLLVLAIFASACNLDESGTNDGGLADVSLNDVEDGSLVADSASDSPLDQAADADTSPPPFTPLQLTGLSLWLRGDMGVQLDIQNHVQSWSDQSSSGIVATPVSTSRAPSSGVHMINGKPTITFAAANQTILALSSFPALAEAHAFVVFQRTSATPPTLVAAGFWMLTGNTGSGACVPYVDGVVYDDFGAAVRHTAAPPPSSMAVPNLYEVVSTSAQWSVSQNGNQFFSDTSNTVSFARTPYFLGADMSGNYFDGDWAEVVVVDHELTVPERALLIAYLNDRYALGSK